MKGIIKYVLIAAVGYFIYDQYKKKIERDFAGDRPSGSGGVIKSKDGTPLESLQGVKSLPYTY